MVDEYTRNYLKELEAKIKEANVNDKQRTHEYRRQLDKTLELAKEIYTCANCTKEREKKKMIQED